MLKRLAQAQRIPSIRNARGARSYVTGVAPPRLYELRTYNVKPESMGSFMKLTNEWIHIRTNASPLLGYWTCELGGINQVVHIWEYETLAHRASVRAELAKNQDWLEKYFGHALKMWDSQTNALIVPKGPINPPTTSGVYVLRQFPGPRPNSILSSPENEDCKLVGVWQTVFGDVPHEYELYQMTSLDAAVQNSINIPHYSKLLVPTVFSPLK